MRRQPVIRSITVSGLILISTAGVAQVAEVREFAGGLNKVAIEVKPFPLSTDMVPGVGSVGAGVEFSGAGSFAPFAEAYGMSKDLQNYVTPAPNQWDDPAVKSMQGYVGDVGVRYYGRPQSADSWFGSGKVGYKYTSGSWNYQDQQVDNSVRTIIPGLEAGYRWSWPSKVLVRLGVGVDANAVQENDVTAAVADTPVTDDARDKIQAYAKTDVIPRMDLGLGYLF